MNGFIDQPSPFAPLNEWDAFLKEMLKLDQNDPDVAEAIRVAKEQIKKQQSR